MRLGSAIGFSAARASSCRRSRNRNGGPITSTYPLVTAWQWLSKTTGLNEASARFPQGHLEPLNFSQSIRPADNGLFRCASAERSAGGIVAGLWLRDARLDILLFSGPWRVRWAGIRMRASEFLDRRQIGQVREVGAQWQIRADAGGAGRTPCGP